MNCLYEMNGEQEVARSGPPYHSGTYTTLTTPNSSSSASSSMGMMMEPIQTQTPVAWAPNGMCGANNSAETIKQTGDSLMVSRSLN